VYKALDLQRFFADRSADRLPPADAERVV